MKTRNPFASLFLLLLAVCVLGAMVSEFIVQKSDTPVACQEEEELGVRCEEELEESLDLQLCWTLFEPPQMAFEHGHGSPFPVFTASGTIASAHALGWRMPLRI